MTNNKTLGIVFLLLLVVGAVFLYTKKGSQNVSVSNADDVAIRAMVIEFGSRFKNVSLLAPDVSKDLAREYGAYVSAELLTQWQSNPSLSWVNSF